MNIPIKVFPATEASGSLAFNQLHAECHTRMQQRRWCATCGREVPQAEIVKGFEFEKNRYVVLDDADFDQVRPPSTRVIDLVQFADAAALDPMFVDRTYYLAPEAPGAEAFALMRDAMKGKVGIGKLALYGREYLVAVRPHARALALHTLHHAAEMRPIEAVDELAAVPTIVRPDDIKLARKVIGAFEGPLNLAEFTDEYRAGLQRIIDAKIAGEEIVGLKAVPPPPVVNLSEALKKSMEALSREKKTPVKASAAKKKRVRSVA